MSTLDFDAAVYAVNEAATIGACVEAIDRACAGHAAHISVLLNGTTDDSIGRLRALRLSNATLAVYRFPRADKASAINHYLYRLRRDAAVTFGVDAYVRIDPAAMTAIARALAACPAANAASGVPASGRSAPAETARILRGGTLAGQFHGIRSTFVDRLVTAGYRLPAGLYRVDGLLGSMLAHDLDAVGTPWNDGRIIGVAEAGFTFTPLSPLKWRDVRRQYRREIRQSRGRIENDAIKSIIYSCGYAGLPGQAIDMLGAWLSSHRPPAATLRERHFTWQALRQLHGMQRIAASEPDLVFAQNR